MLTIGDCVRHANGRFGEQNLARCSEVGYTYTEISDRCAVVATALRSFGLSPGDRVAVLAANCHRYLEVFLAVPTAGLVVVPLNTRLATPELVSIVEDCGPRVLITDRSASEIGELGDRFEQIITWPTSYESMIEATTPLSLEELSQGVTTDRLAALFYTGGTTGRPKGVMLTHENLVSNSFHKTIAVGLRADDVFLAAPAMFHVAGIAPLLSLVTLGARTVFVPGFDAARCLDTIDSEQATMMFPVPTMLAAMVAEQGRDPRLLTSLRMLGHAGSSISVPAIREAAAAFPGVELAQFYGATETASIVTCQHHEEAPEQELVIGSCGQPVIGVTVRVVDADDADVAPGTPGEVIVQGRNIMAGYWNRPDESEAALRNGWYRTGDIGFLDDTQHLFVIDRAKDMIITGAENVYCTEVENVLYAQAGVIEAAVFGVPHEVWGEAVHAVVVVGAESNDSHDAVVARLDAACRAALAGFKVPKAIDVRTELLPKSGPGKIVKRALREPFWADQPIRVR